MTQLCQKMLEELEGRKTLGRKSRRAEIKGVNVYSTAMRRAELCRLKVHDIDSQRMMIRIDQGKGTAMYP